jgi:hypothetical protein
MLSQHPFEEGRGHLIVLFIGLVRLDGDRALPHHFDKSRQTAEAG